MRSTLDCRLLQRGTYVIFMMRFLIACFLLLACVAPQAQGEQDLLLPEEIKLIHATIVAQVQAFRRGDMEAAFAFASPGIQHTFGDAETFGQMVQAGYGQIYSTFSFRFDELIGTTQAPVQVVYFTGTDLSVVVAFYAMTPIPGEGWRIDGVQIYPVDQQAS